MSKTLIQLTQPIDDATPWQYLGRTNAVKAYGYAYNYYVLIYGKHTANNDTGKHTVSVKMRMACEAVSTFHNWATAGSITIDGENVVSWSGDLNPGSYWGNSSSITENGVTYQRWVDMAEVSVELDTARQAKTVSIDVSWQRLSIAGTPPSWLPSITEAKATLSLELPAIEDPVEELPDDEPWEPTDPPSSVESHYTGVRVYADENLVYDSILEETNIADLVIDRGLNVGGTADIVMPPGHPAYNYFVGYKTLVQVYRGNVLRFRGRALYPEDNFIGQRTIKCEGELCFFRDSISRPIKYKGTPGRIFRALVQKHNDQVDGWKQFVIGRVDVTDPAGDIDLEIENAEPILDTLKKLIDRCGGYIIFSTDAGRRVIHYVEDLDRRSNQTIEFGENLLNLTATGANTDNLATCIVPYGAQDEETKNRITIESVNDGKDYLIAMDAVAVRGVIMTSRTWDDVSDPVVLLEKAKKFLEESKLFVTTLEISALDLSYLEKGIDTFTEGDIVRVRSRPHGIDSDFRLTKMRENPLNPTNGQITLGKDIKSLTGWM